MTSRIDLTAAVGFVATHGRILDRRRLELLIAGGDGSAALAALDGYRNADGGYGWGLEPDLRSPESQPVAAMHALEVFAEVTPITPTRAAELCDWLAASSVTDGALPFALPITDPAGCAPWWADPDTTTPSLQITAAALAKAQQVARHDDRVASHPWLTRATKWCLAAIAELESLPQAYELLFAMRFLDAVADAEPAAVPLLERLGGLLPADGVVAVAGGAEGEAIRPLELAPVAGSAARGLFPEEVVAEELRRLAAAQQPDGGWTVDFVSASPAAALEWRAYATVEAVGILRANAGSVNA